MKKTKNEELGRISVEEFKQAEKTPIIVILDNVRSLHNVGSVFRTSDAFRVESVYLCGITACPPNKDIHKTALGSTESVDWKYFENTLTAIDELKKRHCKIVAVEQAENSISLEKYNPTPNVKTALIFGHEVKGVSQEVMNQCDECIEIPQFGTKHSINISVSAGVVIWEVFSKLQLQ